MAELSAAESLDAYVYTPLQNHSEKRLFVLDGGAFDEPIKGSLNHVPIVGGPPFEALSYACGSPEPVARAVIDGRLLPLGHNLLSALRRLRNTSGTRTLWVDAICINQSLSAIREKDHQVAQMKQMYEYANRAIVYLGEHDDDSDLAFQMISNLAAAYESWTPQTQLYYLQDPGGHMANFALPVLGAPAWNFLFKLLDRPWFHRVWVIQEVCCAPVVDVICGWSSLPWDQFYKADLNLSALIASPKFFKSIGPRGTSILRIGDNRSRIHTAGKTTIVELINLIQDENIQSTLEVDRVFAVLGLVAGGQKLDLVPDYTMSFEQVLVVFFTRLLKSLIVRERDLNAISPHTFPDHPPGLPSWVPDFTSALKKVEGLSKDWPLHNLQDICAGGATAAMIRVEGTDETTIAVSGYLIDSIAPTTSSDLFASDFESEKGDRNVRQELLRLIRTEKRPVQSNATSAKPDHPFARAIISTATSGNASPDINHFSNLWAALYPSDSPHAYKPFDFDSEFVPGPFYDASYVKFRRRFLKTANGALAAVPTSARPGDVICILLGAKAPYVLRQRGEIYRVVGQCYVHGIMYGEFVEKPTSSLQELVLR